MLIFTYYGMPLHIVRDLWVSIKNLQQRIASYFRYRKITANLNERFPNPTEEELQETDRTCIICREEMTPGACKKLPCSHIFHVDCLKMWVQRQQTCPTCRSNIPTESRQPTPTVPGGPAAGPAAPAGAADQPRAAPAAPAAPRFRFGVAFGRVVPPPNDHGASGAATPAGDAQATTPPAPGGIPAAAYGGIPAAAYGGIPAAAYGGIPAAAPGYPNPFMSPMMFGPGMGPPYGYGVPGPYGMMLGMPPVGHMPPQSQQGMQQPAIDSDSIRRHIDFLHAQLAVLQASAAQFGASLPTHTVPQQPVVAPSVHTDQPQISVPTQAALRSAEARSPAMTDGATADTGRLEEELEDKRPIPSSSQQQRPLPSTAASPSLPMESTIPSASQTEAERRRDELRHRYNRIYGSSSSSSAIDSEEKKTD